MGDHTTLKHIPISKHAQGTIVQLLAKHNITSKRALERLTHSCEVILAEWSVESRPRYFTMLFSFLARFCEEERCVFSRTDKIRLLCGLSDSHLEWSRVALANAKQDPILRALTPLR